MPLLSLTHMNERSFPDVFPMEAEGPTRGSGNSEGAFLSVTRIGGSQEGQTPHNVQGSPRDHLVLSPAYLSGVLQNLLKRIRPRLHLIFTQKPFLYG